MTVARTRASRGREAVGRVLAGAFPRLATMADAIDARHVARRPLALTPGHPGVPAATWATTRLAAVILATPLLGPLVAGVALRNTRDVLRLIDQYPALLDDVLAGKAVDYPAARVEAVPAAACYFVSSDLHRCIPGTVDWPGHQNTKVLYEVALDHYAAAEWGLVENGDVEDFWLAGGSTYGVTYDLFRLIGHALRGEAGRSLLHTVYRAHLQRIVANNEGIYARIQEGFHRHGRYRRLIGNHDDVYLDEAMVEALGEVHPGVTVADFLLFADGTRARGIATHGHHVDSWNAPFRSGLGKLGTWLGSILLDAPFSSNPGVPDLDETSLLLGGRLPNLLTKVSPHFGANRDLYSVDEVALFQSFQRHYGAGAATGFEGGPILLLGHTHLPLSRPLDPDSGTEWSRYFNSGSGIFFECLTGIEWDGRADPDRPEVRLVAWRYADPDDPGDVEKVVGRDGGRAIVREVLARVEPAPEEVSV